MKLIVKQILCIKLVKYWDKYTEMHRQQNVKIPVWPPDDEHMCSKHVEAWNKTYCETNFVHQVG